MKSAQLNGSSPRTKSHPDTAATQAGNGQDAPRTRLRKPVDGRLRSARRWRTLRDNYLALAPRHDQLCAALATLIVQREALDQASARGEIIDTLLACRLSGEIRRLLTRLGLNELPVEDGTQAAIRALREGREEARA